MLRGQQPLILGVCIPGLILTTLSVGLRFLARIRYGAGLWWDDWVILAALPLNLSSTIFSLQGFIHGYGLKADEMTLYDIYINLKEFYISGFIYATTLGLIKLSILLFYLRIFPTKHVKLGCWILGSLDVAWTIAYNLTWTFNCTPIDKFWRIFSSGQCMDRESFILGTSIPNILLDIGILLLPIQSLWRLQLPISKKLAVIGIFGVAIFAIICSILRTGFSIIEFRYNDFYKWIFAFMWYIAEDDAALICACLPAMKPLFSMAGKKLQAKPVNVVARRFRTEGLQACTYDTESYLHLESCSKSKDDHIQDLNGFAGGLEKVKLAKSDHKTSEIQSPVRSGIKFEQSPTKADTRVGDTWSRLNAPLPALPPDGIRIKKDFGVIQETTK